MSGKGDNRRPRQISREEEDLRYKYAYGKMTFEQYSQRYHALKKRGLIIRGGRAI